MKRLLENRRFLLFAATLLLVVLSLLIGMVLIAISGNSPAAAYRSLFRGAFSTPSRFSELIVKLVPFTINALGVSIAFRAHLWNIGVQGQFIMGGLASCAVALYVPGPAFIVFPLALIAAIAAGGIWAGIAGYLKVRFNANEVITTLMMNYIAVYFLNFLVYGPMMDKAGQMPQSAGIPQSLRLPRIFGEIYRVHTGIFIMAFLVIAIWVLWKSSLGYKIDLIGQGNEIAKYSGLGVKKTIVGTMFLSGAIVGIAGFLEVFGIHYRVLENFAGTYGDSATVVALLGALGPFGILAASFFFSILTVGGAAMQRMTSVPYSVVDVIQGLVIIFAVCSDPLIEWVKRIVKKKSRRKEDA